LTSLRDLGSIAPSVGEHAVVERDHDLVSSYLAGDEGAVSTLDRWIRSAARPFAGRLGSQWEDVLQQIRVETYGLLTRGRFRGDSSLKTYLWRVANHTCIDALRGHSRRQWEPLDDDCEASALEADDGTASLEVADLVLRVLNEVPEHCRVIWRMILDGLSYKEMSERLEVQEGTLRVRALRCRKQALEIRRRLELGLAPS
jgi:RNA polymerase sigma factor (sigma-70 family)